MLISCAPQAVAVVAVSPDPLLPTDQLSPSSKPLLSSLASQHPPLLALRKDLQCLPLLPVMLSLAALLWVSGMGHCVDRSLSVGQEPSLPVDQNKADVALLQNNPTASLDYQDQHSWVPKDHQGTPVYSYSATI